MRLHNSTPYAGISYNIWSKAMYPYSLPRALFDEAVAKERLTVAKSKKIVAFAQIRPGLSAHEPGERYGDPNRRDDGSAGDRSELHDRINQLQKDLSSDGYTVGTADRRSGGKPTTDCHSAPEIGRSVSVRRQIPASRHVCRRGNCQISDFRRDPQSPHGNHATA